MLGFGRTLCLCIWKSIGLELGRPTFQSNWAIYKHLGVPMVLNVKTWERDTLENSEGPSWFSSFYMRNMGPQKPGDIIFNLPHVIRCLSIFTSEAWFIKVNCILEICSDALFPSLASKVILILVPTLQAKGRNDKLWIKPSEQIYLHMRGKYVQSCSLWLYL